MTGLSEIIDELKQLPHFPMFRCRSCGGELRVHALQVYADCPGCGTPHKCRGFAGTKLEDVIDAVLGWAGEGETLEAVLKRHREIMAAESDG
jgi:hypothetical protein